MNVTIASLKFSPGHLSHMIAYAQAFTELGHNAVLYLDKGYKNIYQSVFPVLWYPYETEEDCDLLMICNPSRVNHIVAARLESKGKRIMYLYHEPWDGLLSYLKEGIGQTVKAIGAHYFSTKVLKLSNAVLVPSKYALDLYLKKDFKLNKNVFVVPLLFDDENKKEIDVSEKKYFSYIGHAVKGHAFDLFIDFMKYSYMQKLDIKFSIATRTDLKKLIDDDKILTKMIYEGKLIVSHGKPLKNCEINEFYRNSFCVWNIYRRSTQSGVLPKAFMFGTPVISSNIGSFPEFVKDGYNGYLITSHEKIDFKGILEKILYIRENIEVLSKGCRETFLRIFYYKANVKALEQILFQIESMNKI